MVVILKIGPLWRGHCIIPYNRVRFGCENKSVQNIVFQRLMRRMGKLLNIGAVLLVLAFGAAAQDRVDITKLAESLPSQKVFEPPATVWDAGSLTFTKPPGTQDCITAQTCLARITVLYNSVTGTVSGHQPCPGYTGPSNTEWAYGLISQWNTLTYDKLFNVNECLPPGMADRPMVAHLIAENIYLQVRFNYWNAGNSGFSYARTTGPAASYASISGRLATTAGRAIRRSTVTLKDANGVPRTVTADGDGRYQFDGAPTGASYTISGGSRRFACTPINVSLTTTNATGKDLTCPQL
jgi:hypothetical protein